MSQLNVPDPSGRLQRPCVTCSAFLELTIACLAAHGITRIERLMTDNAGACRYSARRLRCARDPPEVHQAPLPPAGRQGRAPQAHPPDRMGLPAGLHRQRPTSSRTCPWLEHYSTQRWHSALGGPPPISRLSPMSWPGTPSDGGPHCGGLRSLSQPIWTPRELDPRRVK